MTERTARRRGRRVAAVLAALGAALATATTGSVVVGAWTAPAGAASADRTAQQIAKGIVEGSGGKVGAADATCMGKAILAKLGTAGVVKAGKSASFDAMPYATRVAIFDAMKQCPTALGSVIAAGLREAGLDAAPGDALCIGKAAAQQLTSPQMLDLASSAKPSKATMIAVFTAFRACPDSLGPLMTKGLEGTGSIPLTTKESTCMGRGIVTGLTGDELYALGNRELDTVLMTKVFTVVAPCGDALAKLLEAGFEQSDPTLTDAQGMCAARKLLAAFPPAELVAATSGTATSAQKQKLGTAMVKIQAACKTAK